MKILIEVETGKDVSENKHSVTRGAGGGCNDLKWVVNQGFQNKLVTAGVKPATWLHVAGYSGHNNQFLNNNLDCNSCLLF